MRIRKDMVDGLFCSVVSAVPARKISIISEDQVQYLAVGGVKSGTLLS
jgi:hypothetical protein